VKKEGFCENTGKLSSSSGRIQEEVVVFPRNLGSLIVYFRRPESKNGEFQPAVICSNCGAARLAPWAKVLTRLTSRP
jgi:hypothetical protein